MHKLVFGGDLSFSFYLRGSNHGKSLKLAAGHFASAFCWCGTITKATYLPIDLQLDNSSLKLERKTVMFLWWHDMLSTCQFFGQLVKKYIYIYDKPRKRSWNPTHILHQLKGETETTKNSKKNHNVLRWMSPLNITKKRWITIILSAPYNSDVKNHHSKRD